MIIGLGIFLAAIFAILTGIGIWTLPETKGKDLEVLEKSQNSIKKGFTETDDEILN